MAVEKKAEKTPKKYKGFSKLPEAVQKKIDPDLANKYVKGGRVSFKSRRERQKAQARPSKARPTMTTPRPINLGTTPKPTTFTGKINTETQKLQNIDGKTVVVNKSNESGRSISDADRARISKMMGGFGKKKLKGMKKGGLVKGGTSSQMTGKEYKGIF